MFYRRQTPAAEIIKALGQLAEGQRISSVTRTTGHKEDTILAWLREAATHVSQIEAVLMADYRLTRGQLDGLWAYVGNKGEKRAILKPRRLASSGVPPCLTSTPASALRGALPRPKRKLPEEVFQTLKERGHPDAPPPTMSDGWGGIDNAMIAVYGRVPEYSGHGRPPTQKQPQLGWQYLQMVKHRDDRGRLLSTELRVIYGKPEDVLALFGKSTAYIERTHLTMRLFNGRLVRHTLGFSKKVALYRASAAWEDANYNLARPLKTLRLEVTEVPGRRWRQRSPAMAAGLTDHIWTVKELLTAIVPPNT